MTSPDPPLAHAGHKSGARVETVELDQHFDVDSLHPLRAALAAHASRLGATDEQLEHLLIVAGELASNAIRHGGGSGRLRLWQRDRVLYCQVNDQGPGLPTPRSG